jgi:hypothetical protein
MTTERSKRGEVHCDLTERGSCEESEEIGNKFNRKVRAEFEDTTKYLPTDLHEMEAMLEKQEQKRKETGVRLLI